MLSLKFCVGGDLFVLYTRSKCKKEEEVQGVKWQGGRKKKDHPLLILRKEVYKKGFSKLNSKFSLNFGFGKVERRRGIFFFSYIKKKNRLKWIIFSLVLLSVVVFPIVSCFRCKNLDYLIDGRFW